jgi:hypothetical protein
VNQPANLGQARREAKAREIAEQIDAEAGGYFRRCLERAALLGMEFMMTPENKTPGR